MKNRGHHDPAVCPEKAEYKDRWAKRHRKRASAHDELDEEEPRPVRRSRTCPHPQDEDDYLED